MGRDVEMLRQINPFLPMLLFIMMFVTLVESILGLAPSQDQPGWGMLRRGLMYQFYTRALWMLTEENGDPSGVSEVPAASLQRGSNLAQVTGSSSSRKKRLSVSVTSSTKCSRGLSFTDRASRLNSAKSFRLRARAPPFR